MTMVDTGEPTRSLSRSDPFPVRLRGAGRWRRSLAADARMWQAAPGSSLGDLDPMRRAAARFAAELDLTATVYELIHEGLPQANADRCTRSQTDD